MYQTCISDHHKMIISVLRKTFAKGKPKTVFYRCYKNFDQDSFNETLNSMISLPNLSFFIISIHVRFFLLLINQKIIRYNNNPLMTKRLRKEIMIRSKLRHKFNKSHTCVNLQNYRKQRNKCTKVPRKAKQQYLNNLNSKSITDTTKFEDRETSIL